MIARLAALICALVAGGPALAGTEVLPMSVDGRGFVLAQPEGATGPLPLVLALAGAGSDAGRMQRGLPLLDTGRKTAFRVAYLGASRFVAPDGRRLTAWNDGVCCGSGIRPEVDDLGYLADVIAHLDGLGLVAPGREIAVVGHSNGAQMAYRLVCAKGARVFALVALSGGLAVRDCGPLQGLRALGLSGTEDDRYPPEGGPSAFDPRIVHDSPQAARDSLAAAGASFRWVPVAGAGHAMASLDRRLSATTGTGLAATVAEFLFPE